mgnify:CR=1 FL=1
MTQTDTTEKTIIGIDYSLNSPAICIATGDLSFENCKFYYVSSKKKYIGKFGKNIIGSEYKEWTDPIVRFNNLLFNLNSDGGEGLILSSFFQNYIHSQN